MRKQKEKFWVNLLINCPCISLSCLLNNTKTKMNKNNINHSKVPEAEFTAGNLRFTGSSSHPVNSVAGHREVGATSLLDAAE